MKRKSNSVLLILSVLSVLSLTSAFGASPARAADAWDRSFFATDGEDLVAAASAATRSGKGDVVVLLDEGSFSFDGDGRCTTRYRVVYRIMTAAGLENWSTVASGWSPWNQERPNLKARVVTPDGVEHRLAQETISDGPEQDEAPDLFSDRRVVRAPLPAITVGAVVEEEITVRETAPSFAAGESRRFFFGRGVETRKTRLILESPANRPIRYLARLLPDLDIEKSEKDGRERLTFEMGAMQPLKLPDPGLPPDAVRWPAVDFTSATSWSDVAKSYGAIVDRQIGRDDMTAFVRGIVGDTSRREVIVEKLLARIRKDVRYTGIEFGNGSTVPHTPQETLAHGYGDCKDQAVLLVKMLRAAWVPAFVALIRSGSGEDIDADIPGIDSFNHAIVYIPGATSLWIDPTNRFRPAGELPIGDQGRRAMIAAEGFPALLTTPEARSTENSQLETREFFLSETGAARVVETTRFTGSIAGAYRSDYGGADQKELRKQLTRYVENAYLAKKLDDLQISEPDDLSKTFTIRLEAKDAERGMTDGEEAAAAILPSFLADRLPPLLTGEGEKKEKGDRKPSAAARQSDYLLPEPYLFVATYRIVPPPGYRLKNLPDSASVTLGPMSYSKTFHQETDGSVTAVLRLDTGKRRMNPGEFEAARKGIRQLRSEGALLVSFEQTGQALIAAGKVREGLAELRRLAALHPDEALHHVELASALLKLGLGRGARKEAERAVELEPGSFLAHRTLAFALQHDLIGRLRGKGFDRAAALAEYRKAKELNPDDLVTRGDLAILLEHDKDGVRYSRKADVAGAITEYLAIRSELKQSNLDQNLLLCLVASRRWKELKSVALAVENLEERDRFLLTAIAADEGVPAAVKEAQHRISDAATRAKTLEAVASQLAKCRRYREAADLLEESARGNANAASLRTRSAVLRKVRRFEEVLPGESGPTAVVKRMMVSLAVPEVAPDRFLSLFSSALREETEREPRGRESLQETFDALRQKMGEDLDAREAYADVAVTAMEFQVEGNDGTGYRIDISAPGLSVNQGFRLFVGKEAGRYRILASAVAPEPLGLEALRRLERRDFTGAAVLLDWVHDQLASARVDDPLSENPFRLLWQPGETDPQQMRLAAAALVSGMSAAPPQAASCLLEHRATARGETRRAIDIALLKWYRSTARWDQLLQHSDRIAASYPHSGIPFKYAVAALEQMRRWDEAAARAQERLQVAPTDANAIRALAQVAAEHNDLEQSANWYRMLEKGGRADAHVCNELAWLGLFGTVDLAESLKLGERSVSLTESKEPAFMHTLSALYAETGNASEAREMILKVIAAGRRGAPGPSDWYVLGRIAEEYGEMEEARAAYEKVTEPGPETISATSTYMLARKRLAKY